MTTTSLLRFQDLLKIKQESRRQD